MSIFDKVEKMDTDELDFYLNQIFNTNSLLYCSSWNLIGPIFEKSDIEISRINDKLWVACGDYADYFSDSLLIAICKVLVHDYLENLNGNYNSEC